MNSQLRKLFSMVREWLPIGGLAVCAVLVTAVSGCARHRDKALKFNTSECSVPCQSLLQKIDKSTSQDQRWALVNDGRQSPLDPRPDRVLVDSQRPMHFVHRVGNQRLDASRIGATPSGAFASVSAFSRF